MRNMRAALVLIVAALGGADSEAAHGSEHNSAVAREQLEGQEQRSLTTMSHEALASAFIGTWLDERGRFWFAIDEIIKNEVRAASFRLASLKEGHVTGDSLILVSSSCVILLGCYEYIYEGKLLTPTHMDMYGIGGRCSFAAECTEEGEIVHFFLVKE